MTSSDSPPTAPPRILLISHDVVGDSMAGPGIRYLTLARVLARHVPLTFAIPNAVPAEVEHVREVKVHVNPGEAPAAEQS